MQCAILSLIPGHPRRLAQSEYERRCLQHLPARGMSGVAIGTRRMTTPARVSRGSKDTAGWGGDNAGFIGLFHCLWRTTNERASAHAGQSSSSTLTMRQSIAIDPGSMLGEAVGHVRVGVADAHGYTRRHVPTKPAPCWLSAQPDDDVCMLPHSTCALLPTQLMWSHGRPGHCHILHARHTPDDDQGMLRVRFCPWHVRFSL